MKHRIALIVVWFGKLPNYHEFWMKSVERNPSVDFLLVTDQVLPSPPPNLRVINMSFADVVSKTQGQFDFKVNIPQPYKFCDFKPAYGEIFHDIISDYDFWGHCDNDLIFGDIRHFITDDVLDAYDRILMRGHFTLYRNTQEVNSIYRSTTHPTFREVFTSPRNYCYDEWPGTSKYWLQNFRDRLYNIIIFDDINYKRYDLSKVHKSAEEMGDSHAAYSYEDGRLFRICLRKGRLHKEQTMYVHFQKRRLAVQTAVSNWFTIVPNKIVDYVECIDADYLKRNCKSHLIYPHLLKTKFTTLKRKTKAFFAKNK